MNFTDNSMKYIIIFNDINRFNIGTIQSDINNADMVIKDTFVAVNEEVNIDAISNALDNKEIANTIEDIVNKYLIKISNNDTIIKNGRAKVYFHLAKVFLGIINSGNKKIVVIGDISKYEMLTLYVLSQLGNEVTIISKNVDKLKINLYNNIDYRESKTDNWLIDELKFSDTNQGIILQNGTAIDKLEYSEYDFRADTELAKIGTDKLNIAYIGYTQELGKYLLGLTDNINQNTDIVIKDGLKALADKEVLDNFRESSIKNNKSYVMAMLNCISNGVGTERKHDIINSALDIISTNDTRVKLFNTCCVLINWINTYIREDTKLIVYYGVVNENIGMFLHIASKCGINTITICTDIDKFKYKYDFGDVYRIGDTHPIYKYPDSAEADIQSTIAYNASQEVDRLLYNGETPGLYKDRQFSTCKNIILNTTIDEVKLLWNEPNQLRTGFSSSENRVSVPTFFIKMNGVINDNSSDYKKWVEGFVTEHTIVRYGAGFISRYLSENKNIKMRINHLTSVNGTKFGEQIPMIVNDKVDMDVVAKYSNYSYRHLSKGVQVHLLSKIQDIIDLRCIKANEYNEEILDKILTITLNLDDEVLKNAQWYDFTKCAPKLIVLCQDSSILTIEDSIYIAYLSRLGFDVMIAVPTGYNITDNLNSGLIQEIILGDPKFDTNISELNADCNCIGIRSNGKFKSFISKLFK